MESSGDVEALSRAIEKLLHEKRTREAGGDHFIEDNDDHLLLSRLFSQLESSSPKASKRTDETTKEEDKEAKQSIDSLPSKGKHKHEGHLEKSVEEIAKDIKKMKRQNTITQVLLSAMIFLTLTWQLSEFSIIFMVKERLSHPIRYVGRMLSGMFSGIFKGKTREIQYQLHETSFPKDQDNHHNNGNNETNNGAAHLQMPELLRDFGFNEDKD